MGLRSRRQAFDVGTSREHLEIGSLLQTTVRRYCPSQRYHVGRSIDVDTNVFVASGFKEFEYRRRRNMK